MREIDYVFYMTLLYIISCLYGFFYKVIDILNFQNINFGYIGIFIIFIMSYLFLPIKHNKTMEKVVKFITKIIIWISLILMGMNYPKQWLMGLTIYMVSVLAISLVSQKKVKESINELELYPSRKTQEDILTYALENYNLIALDGTWGSGKTTFMDIVMKSNREKYYYISINIMLFENRNSLKTEFLNQLKGVFKEEGIFQGSLMDFDYYLDGVSNDWIKVVNNIIFSKSKSFKEANEKLKSEIGKIEKRIVVGVDNLERIYGESEHEWKQILGFIHELQELGIKIVVMANLEEMLTTNKKTEEKIKLVLNSKDDSEIKFFGDVEIQKIEQEKNDNYNYFDKFYEFKLQLNEVTTEEIINKIKDVLEDEKSLIKKQFNSLTNSLKQKEEEINYKIKEITKGEMGRSLASNPSEEYLIKRQIEVREKEKPLLELLLNLEKKYYENSKNPRKIEKIIEDIKLKKIIKKIHNIDPKEYEKLIFITSVFQLFYFDYYYRFKREGVAIFSDSLAENNPINKNYPIEDIFLEYIKHRFKNNLQAVNRLLYFEPEDENVRDRIENLIEENKINIYDFRKYIEDIKIYSQRLDNSDMELTKEKYKIIQNNMVRLEKEYKENIHEIIKENEEFICEMNYLCYPDKVGIYGEVSYKFEMQKINRQYKGIIDTFNKKNCEYNNSNEKVYLMISSYYLIEKKFINLVTKEELEKLINLIDEEKNPNIIMELKNRSLYLFFSEKAERIKLKRIITLLNILKIELSKKGIIGKKNSLIISVKEWEKINKSKFIEKIRYDYCYDYFDKKCEDFKEMRINLEKLIEGEKSKEYMLGLESLIRSLKIHELPSQIRETISKIEIEQDVNKKEKKTYELIDFINERTSDKKYQYIYNDSWNSWIDKAKEIKIEVDLENKKVKLQDFAYI